MIITEYEKAPPGAACTLCGKKGIIKEAAWAQYEGHVDLNGSMSYHSCTFMCKECRLVDLI